MIERGLVWTGGGLFVASLALAAYVFGFIWPAAVPLGSDRLAAAVAVNAMLFTAFALHHSVLARDSVKTRLMQVLPARLLRSVYVWASSLLFIVTMLCWQPIGHVVYDAAGWPSPVLHLIQGAGLALIVSAAHNIDALELAGIRSAARDRLVVRGPYRLVRHPLYLGWLLIVWGPPLMTGDRMIFAVLSSAYLLLAMPWEEESMARTLGRDYEVYRATVRWRLVPGVY